MSRSDQPYYNGFSLTLGQMIQFIRHPSGATFLSQRKAFSIQYTTRVSDISLIYPIPPPEFRGIFLFSYPVK